MKIVSAFSLLLLIIANASSAFSHDDPQDNISYDAHVISVQEYCQCLVAVASADDQHGLYDATTQSGEILQTIFLENQQPRFLYGIARGLDPESPMLGLTDLDAMRFCNWMETSLSTSDNVIPSTEVGSYVLHEDGSFEVNKNAQLFILPHDNGSFQIISKVINQSTSPLTMFDFNGSEKSEATSKNQEQAQRSSTESRNLLPTSDKSSTLTPMNLTIPSSSPLSAIFYNDAFNETSLIGHTKTDSHDGSFVAINDPCSCLPTAGKNLLRNCLLTSSQHDAIKTGRDEVRTHLEQVMQNDRSYITKGNFKNSLNTAKIQQDLQRFDQHFSNHDLTPSELEKFFLNHTIHVEAKPTRSNEAAGSINSQRDYGSVQTRNDKIVEITPLLEKKAASSATGNRAPLKSSDFAAIGAAQQGIARNAAKAKTVLGSAEVMNERAGDFKEKTALLLKQKEEEAAARKEAAANCVVN